MILHIFSDSPYTFRFIEFINKIFKSTDHQFIILLNKDSRYIDFYKNVSNCNIIYSQKELFSTAKKFIKAKKIILHQLNQPRLLAFIIVFYPAALKKMTWVIWGGDVHFLCGNLDSIKNRLIAKVYAHAIKKFPAIAAHIPGDYRLVADKYYTHAKYVKLKYPSPINKESIGKVKIKPKEVNDTINVMIGNSGDPSNEHIDAFKILSRFKDENIKVSTVLSYGGDRKYIESVVAAGEYYFGDKFTPIIKYMPFDEYINVISNIDICVFNHKRQQGIGNLYLFFALGSKVFICNKVTTFNYYKSIGINLYATEDIKSMNFEKLCEIDIELRKKNMVNIEYELESEQIRLGWKAHFN